MASIEWWTTPENRPEGQEQVTTCQNPRIRWQGRGTAERVAYGERLAAAEKQEVVQPLLTVWEVL